jgi:uncharacterized membrane protein
MTTTSPTSSRGSSAAIAVNRVLYLLSHHWMLVFSVAFGLYVGLPFLPPVFMRAGWESPAKDIYFIYSFLCHQLPQRSFFLFGSKSMYSLSEIQDAWQNTINPLILRQFIGNPTMGWKVAWSDRMVSMYTSILFFGWLWWLLRRKLKPLPFWGLILLSLPMAVDGTSHLISDFAGIGQGFRDSNAWLAALTDNAFPTTFYAGDALGSFNSWMRLITGALFGLGVVWFSFPYLEATFADIARSLKTKFQRAGLES